MKNNTLPEKCCANCGFLYGLAKSPYRPEDSIFDPDIMREESYDSEGFPNHLAKIISTIGYYTKSPDTSETPVMTAHTWEYTAKICCYKKKFDPLHPTWKTVKEEIQQNRKDCDGFFDYHPGHTPIQHIKLQIQEERFQQQESLAKHLSSRATELQKLSLELEKKAIETAKSLNRATWSLFLATIALLIVAILQLINK